MFAMSMQSSRSGNTVVTTTSVAASSQRSGVMTSAVLVGTEGRADRDVRVDEVPAGAWAFVAGGSVVTEHWVGFRGRVVEVRHGR